MLNSKPRETDGVDSVIVVDGIPSVGPDRLDRLKNVIRKTFIKFGKLVNEHYPVDEEGKTKGNYSDLYTIGINEYNKTVRYFKLILSLLKLLLRIINLMIFFFFLQL